MDKVERAHQSKRLMDDDTLISAFDGVSSACVAVMSNHASTDEQVLEARRELLALNRVKSRLASFIADGRIEQKRKSGP